MWVMAQYEATSLFSLKNGLATSSAGKTLLVPTPFALKMALLDAFIRNKGLAQGKQAFDWLRDLEVAINPAQRAVVTNLFTKIQKPRRTDGEKKNKEDKAADEGDTAELDEAGESGAGAGPFGPTIAYREYVHFQGAVGLAFRPRPTLFETEALRQLPDLLIQLNYLGKRGGFWQLIGPVEQTEELPADFVELTDDSGRNRFGGIVQVLDDCGPQLTFEKVDIYSDTKIRAGKERVARPVVLPYRLIKSSRSYSYYERLD